jgi:primosomal protein N' (replication factor Y)
VLAMALRVNAWRAEPVAMGWARAAVEREAADPGRQSRARRARRRRRAPHHRRARRAPPASRPGVVRGLADAGAARPGRAAAPAMPSPGRTLPIPVRRCRMARPPPPPRCVMPSPPAVSPSRCSTASPARARPRSILEAIAACAAPPGGRRSCCCPEIALSAQWLRPVPRPLRRRSRDLAFRSLVARPAQHLARRRRWRGAGGGRRPLGACSCPSPTSASSSSTRSTRPRSSRRKASSTTRGTWRSSAPACATPPAILVSATPSLETVANVEAGRYGRAASARTGTAARRCRRSG